MTGTAAGALFTRLVSRYLNDPLVTVPTTNRGGKFGASALKVNGKIFAMMTRGELVVKLSRQRVDELVVAGTGRRFDPGHGRLMKEWVAVSASDARIWNDIAEEARQYVIASGAGDTGS